MKSDNYEHLLKSFSLKVDKEKIIRCYSRLKAGSENKQPIVTSRNHDSNNLVVLKCHAKVIHESGKQTFNEFRNEFWINRGRNYIRKILNVCFICKRIKLQSYGHLEKSNLPGYRVSRTVPFQVCAVDYVGPIFVKDICCSSNDEMHKVYIILFKCSTLRAVILKLVEENTSKTLLIVSKS